MHIYTFCTKRPGRHTHTILAPIARPDDCIVLASFASIVWATSGAPEDPAFTQLCCHSFVHSSASKVAEAMPAKLAKGWSPDAPEKRQNYAGTAGHRLEPQTHFWSALLA